MHNLQTYINKYHREGKLRIAKSKFTYVDKWVFEQANQSKTLKPLLESLTHILYTNYINLKIPIRPIHGKPLKEHIMATNKSQPQLHTLPKPQNWHMATPTLHLHPPTHKRPSHSPTQQSGAPNSPHTPIQQTHKLLDPIKCWEPTQPASRHHNSIMVNTMHMHGPARTRHIMILGSP